MLFSKVIISILFNTSDLLISLFSGIEQEHFLERFEGEIIRGTRQNMYNRQNPLLFTDALKLH